MRVVPTEMAFTTILGSGLGQLKHTYILQAHYRNLTLEEAHRSAQFYLHPLVVVLQRTTLPSCFLNLSPLTPATYMRVCVCVSLTVT